MPVATTERLRLLVGRTSVRQAAGAGLLWAALLLICFIAGLLTIVAGDFGAQRPALLLALPMLLVLGFAFFLAPKGLVIGILLLRACLDPVFGQGRLPGIGGVGGLVNLAIIVLAFALTVRDSKRIPKQAWMVWIPFMVFQLAGLAYAPDFLPALRLFLGQMATMAVFLLAFHLVDDWSSFDRALKIIVASSVPVVIYTLIAIASGDRYGSLDGFEASSSRYSGPFPHPNILAFYVVLVIGVLLYQWKNARSSSGMLKSAAFIGYAAILVVLLFATKTRSAWVSALFLFLVYGLMVQRRYLIYLALVSAVALLVPDIRDRVLELGQGNQVVQYAKLNSFAWRKLLWTEGLTWMSPSHYLFGYGAGSFSYHATTFFSMGGGRANGAHSVAVQQFFELGVGGLLSFLWMFWSSIKQLIRMHATDSVMKAIFGALILSYVLIALSDNMLSYLTFNWYFWFAVGAALSVGVHQRSQTESVATPQMPSHTRLRVRSSVLG